jgi:hypothetical protein
MALPIPRDPAPAAVLPTKNPGNLDELPENGSTLSYISRGVCPWCMILENQWPKKNMRITSLNGGNTAISVANSASAETTTFMTAGQTI